MCERINFLGLPFHDMTMQEVLRRIEAFIAERVPRKIFTPNVALLVWSRRDPFLRAVYRSSDLLPIDGMAIYYASRILRPPFTQSLSASLLFFPLLELAQSKRYRVYFLGAREDVLTVAIKNLRLEYPTLEIVGWHNGYFDMDDTDEIVDEIRHAEPDILFVGMSSPRKEQFVERNLESMNIPVSIGVGGMIDIAAGEAKFAPNWIRVLCLEWFYRLVQEPRRMWKRYFTTNSVFLWLVFRDLLARPFRRARGTVEMIQESKAD